MAPSAMLLRSSRVPYLKLELSIAPFPCCFFFPTTPAGPLLFHPSLMTASCDTSSINLFIFSISLSSWSTGWFSSCSMLCCIFSSLISNLTCWMRCLCIFTLLSRASSSSHNQQDPCYMLLPPLCHLLLCWFNSNFLQFLSRLVCSSTCFQFIWICLLCTITLISRASNSSYNSTKSMLSCFLFCCRLQCCSHLCSTPGLKFLSNYVEFSSPEICDCLLATIF
jgi:hypothetical protein